MKKLPIIILTLLILILPLVTADETEYVTDGVTIANTYIQDGRGQWAGTNGVVYQTGGNFLGGGVIKDIDNDGTKEIIVHDHDAGLLKIYNRTGIYLMLEKSENIGIVTDYPTPALIDYDSDNYEEIVITNKSHILVYEWNTTALTLEQSQPKNVGIPAGNSLNNQYPNIKCSLTGWADGKIRCLTTSYGTNTAFGMYLLNYNLEDDILETDEIFAATDTRMKLSIGAVDGVMEGFIGEWDSNRYYYVWNIVVNASGNSSTSNIATHDYGSTGYAEPIDLILNDMVGDSNPEITITHELTSADNTWAGKTWDANGALLENFYCNSLQCAQGETRSTNMFVCGSSSYCPFPNKDVCYVTHSQSESPADTTTIACFTLAGGDSYQNNEVTDYVTPTTSPFNVHYAEIYGSGVAGVITSEFGVGLNTKLTNPPLDYGLILPVDYEDSGALDLIGFSSTTLSYYDDGYINFQVEITDYELNPKSPVCLDSVTSFTVDISDTEDDTGYCEFKEEYVNGTVIEVFGNVSFDASTDTSVSATYNPDSVGNFVLKVYCTDSYHEDSSRETFERAYAVKNESTDQCYKFDEVIDEGTLIIDEDDIANDEFTDKIDTALEDVGVSGSKAKAFIWVLLMLGLAIILGMNLGKVGAGGSAPMVIAFAEVIMLVLGWVLGFIGTAIVVTLAIFCSIFLVILFLGKASSGGV